MARSPSQRILISLLLPSLGTRNMVVVLGVVRRAIPKAQVPTSVLSLRDFPRIFLKI
jgi:hypothetical protein